MAAPSGLSTRGISKVSGMRDHAAFARSLWQQRRVILRLAAAQLRERYAATVLGAGWAVLQPLTMIAIYWFVFAYGLRISSTALGAPFALYLVVGIVVWLLFADGVLGATHSVTRSAFLVKKVAFPLEVLPIVPVASALAIHAIALLVVLAVSALYGHLPGANLILLPLYVSCTLVLAAGIGYLAAALNVLHRDIGEIIALGLQLWFWLCPIVWVPDVFPETVRTILDLNPLAFVVNGYRHAILGMDAPNVVQTASFCVTALFAWLAGTAVYRHLRPDFADAL